MVGGLYSITALRKTGAENKVYSRHQELKQASKQASKQAPQPIHELLVATEAVGEIFIFEESACGPIVVRVRPSVVLVLERVLPAVPGPLVTMMVTVYTSHYSVTALLFIHSAPEWSVRTRSGPQSDDSPSSPERPNYYKAGQSR